MQSKDLIVAGSVPLSKALNDVVKAGELNSLDEADVGPYLRENLHWRLAKVSSDHFHYAYWVLLYKYHFERSTKTNLLI